MTQEVLAGCRLVPLAMSDGCVQVDPHRQVPFPIERLYYMYGTEAGVSRNVYAHRTLTEMAVAIAGSCTVILDDGTDRVHVGLEDPSLGLTLSPMVWHEIVDFSPDCVLVVFADARSDDQDSGYIRSYEEFRKS